MLGVSFFIAAAVISYPGGLLYRHSRGAPVAAGAGVVIGIGGVLTILMIFLPGFIAVNGGLSVKEFFMATAGVALGVGLGVATARETPATRDTLHIEGLAQGRRIADVIDQVSGEAKRVVERHIPDEPLPWVAVEGYFIRALRTAWYADYKESVRSMVIPVVGDEVWNGFTEGLLSAQGVEETIDLDGYERHLEETTSIRKSDRVGLWLVKEMMLEKCTFGIDSTRGPESIKRRKRVIRELGLLYMQAYTTHAHPFRAARMAL